MPIIMVTLGLLAIISSVRGTEHKLAAQIATDFSGSNSFAYWIIAIFIIGAIGYAPGMENVSTMFMVLCLLTFTLSENGAFDKFADAMAKL